MTISPISYTKYQKPRWERPFWRTVFFAAMTFVALAALVIRLILVQIVHGEEYRAAAQANQIRLIPVAAPRGLIYDRNGIAMVRSRPSFVVAVIPSEMHDARAEIAEVARTIDVPFAKLWKRFFHHQGINYTSVDEIVTYEPYGPIILAEDLPVPKVARLSEILKDMPGVDLEVQAQRNYPHHGAGAAIFGYVGQITPDEYKSLKDKGYSPNDVVGKDGIEYVYDQYLRGQPGGQRIVVDAAGQAVPDIKLPEKLPQAGDRVYLNIDWRLEAIVEKALADGIHKWAPSRKIGGAVAVLDPYSGDVLALASFPHFDPNDFADNNWRRVTFDLTDASQPLFNRAISAATPTGSTFKMVTGSAAITEHVVRVNENVYDSGYWNCYGAAFRDIASGGLGNTTFVRALAASSDGYFYQMGYRLGNARLRKYALLFGLNAKSGIDLPGEYAGNFADNAYMMRVAGLPLEPADVCSLAIGQGPMEATPLQMANVVSVVVNGGTLYRPRVLKEVRDLSGRVIKANPPEIIRHVPVTAEALKAVYDGMSQVTDPGGTAYGLAIDGLPFGGKTGTAETAGGSGPNTTWFVAFAPAKHPKLAMAVFVDRSGGYGAQVAAPIAREIMVKYFNKKE